MVRVRGPRSVAGTLHPVPAGVPRASLYLVRSIPPFPSRLEPGVRDARAVAETV